LLLSKSVFVVGFAGVESREAAEALIGQTLMVLFVEAIVPEVGCAGNEPRGRLATAHEAVP